MNAKISLWNSGPTHKTLGVFIPMCLLGHLGIKLSANVVVIMVTAILDSSLIPSLFWGDHFTVLKIQNFTIMRIRYCVRLDCSQPCTAILCYTDPQLAYMPCIHPHVYGWDACQSQGGQRRLRGFRDWEKRGGHWEHWDRGWCGGWWGLSTIVNYLSLKRTSNITSVMLKALFFIWK